MRQEWAGGTTSRCTQCSARNPAAPVACAPQAQHHKTSSSMRVRPLPTCSVALAGIALTVASIPGKVLRATAAAIASFESCIKLRPLAG